MSTRSLSALVSASCLLLLFACGKKEEAPPPPAADAAPAADTDAEKVVNVYNWSDYIEPEVLKEFEKDTGVKVNYEVMDSNELLETKSLGLALHQGSAGFAQLDRAANDPGVKRCIVGAKFLDGAGAVDPAGDARG